jgi:hypothetical protein
MPGDLVAKNPRQRPADVAVDHVQVRMTHPRPKHPHNPLGTHRLQIPPILKHQRLTRRTQHSRAHERPTYPRQQRGASSGNNQHTRPHEDLQDTP